MEPYVSKMRYKFRFSYLCRRLRTLKRTVRISEILKEALCKICKEEFQLKKACLTHDNPEVFVLCHWQKSGGVHPVWLAYRVIMALYFLGSFLYSLLPIGREVTEEQSKKYFIFLTNWTYTLESFLFIFAFILVAIKKCKGNQEAMTSVPWYYKLYWVVNTIVLSAAVTVSLLFWTEVYDPELFPANAANIIVHALNSVFLIFDFCLIAHPIRVLHFYIPFTYGFVYCIFSLIYEMAGGTGVKGMDPIYEVLDWKNEAGQAVVTCLMALTILLILHFIFSFFSVLKTFTKEKQNESGNDV